MKCRCFRTISALVAVIAIAQSPYVAAKAQMRVDSKTKAARPQLIVQLGHAGAVKEVAFSFDGRYVLTAGWDQIAVLWEADTGREIRRLDGHKGPVISVAFSPDGRSVVTGSIDDTAALWDIASGKRIHHFVGHSGDVNCVRFSPDGKHVLTGSADESARLWNTSTGKEVRSFRVQRDFQMPFQGIRSVAFSPNGQYVLTGGGDSRYNNSARLWDTATGKEIRQFTGHSGSVSVSFSPDGRYVLTASSDKTARLWDVNSGNEIRRYESPQDGIGSAAFSPDQRFILTTGSRTVRLLDAATGEEVRLLDEIGMEFLYLGNAVFSPDGKTAAIGNGYVVNLLDVRAGVRLRQFQRYSPPFSSLRFSQDGRFLLVGQHGDALRPESVTPVWDLTTGKEVQRFEGQTVALSPDGRLVLTADKATMFLWDSVTGRRLRRFDNPGLQADNRGFYALKSGDFSPDGRFILTTHTDLSARLWDVVTGHQIWTGKGVTASLSPSGRLLLTAPGDWSAKVWDVNTQKEMGTFSPKISNARFFTNDYLILLSYPDSSVGLFDTRIRKEVRRFRNQSVRHVSELASLDNRILIPSSTGQFLLTGGSGADSPGFAVLWNAITGNEALNLQTDYPVNALALSIDEKYVVIGTSDGTVSVRETATGKEVSRFNVNASYPGLRFTPDGTYLLTISGDGTTRFWEPTTGNELCKLLSLSDGSWAVIDSEGRFDTNNLEEIKGLHWIMPDEPMRALPLEIFMRDYYEPELLPRLLKCNQLKNCKEEFKPVPDLSKLSRVQPRVQIKDVSIPDAGGYVNVTLEIGPGEEKGKKEGKNVTRAPEVFDLRLFRDGQMVAYWPRDAADRRLEQSAKDLRLGNDVSDEARLLPDELNWRQLTRVPLGPAGRKTLTARVRLPKGMDISKTEFTAYAFNEDRVKSQTAKWTWPSNIVAKLPAPRAVKPRAYIITIGVNASENPSWRLQYAVNDALKMQQILSDKLKLLKQPDGASDRYEVIALPLISDYNSDGTTLKSNDATKKKIQAVIDMLAGRKTDATLFLDLKANVPQLSQLKKAEPDDLILISFSSHGYADRNGNFFLLPYDIGSSSQITPELLLRSISSDELSLWLRDVDAGEMVMIIDACHAAAFTGKDFKPGPMGSRGLGQLAYDKGMRILTATQANDFALESGALGQGLLSYALLENGLREGRADFKPTPDGKITMKEWLEFGAAEVPALYEKIRRRELKVVGEGARAVVAMPIQRSQGFQQRPSLFDFARKRADVIIGTAGARTNNNPP